MKLLAVSDVHLSHAANRHAFARISPRRDDWLILAGDVGEKYADLEFAFRTVVPRFKQVVWVPGNHELWTRPSDDERERGQFRYERLVALCRSYGVLTPEDPYPVWDGPGGPRPDPGTPARAGRSPRARARPPAR